MNGYPLQLVTATSMFEVSLRRYRRLDETRHEDAEVVIGQEQLDIPYHGTGGPPGAGDIERTDPRWPTHAPSGAAFLDTDSWQVRRERLFQLPDGSCATLAGLPSGACYEAEPESEATEFLYYRASRQYREQHAATRGLYMVKIPGLTLRGDWFSPDWICSDREATQDGWQVSGTLANLTVSPSIHMLGSYHGWLGTAGWPPGVLSNDIDGRPY